MVKHFSILQQQSLVSRLCCLNRFINTVIRPVIFILLDYLANIHNYHYLSSYFLQFVCIIYTNSLIPNQFNRSFELLIIVNVATNL